MVSIVVSQLVEDLGWDSKEEYEEHVRAEAETRAVVVVPWYRRELHQAIEKAFHPDNPDARIPRHLTDCSAWWTEAERELFRALVTNGALR